MLMSWHCSWVITNICFYQRCSCHTDEFATLIRSWLCVCPLVEFVCVECWHGILYISCSEPCHIEWTLCFQRDSRRCSALWETGTALYPWNCVDYKILNANCQCLHSKKCSGIMNECLLCVFCLTRRLTTSLPWTADGDPAWPPMTTTTFDKITLLLKMLHEVSMKSPGCLGNRLMLMLLLSVKLM